MGKVFAKIMGAAPLGAYTSGAVAESDKKPVIALILGGFIPGAGQIYAGRVGWGCAIMAVVGALCGGSLAWGVRVAIAMRAAHGAFADSEWLKLLASMGIFLVGALIWFAAHVAAPFNVRPK